MNNFLVNNYVSVLKKYVEFKGCASRSEFWWFALVSFLVSILLGIIAGIVHLPLSILYFLAVLLPSIAVGARRLRDAGFSPWLMLLLLIPLVQLALIVLWIFPTKK